MDWQIGLFVIVIIFIIWKHKSMNNFYFICLFVILLYILLFNLRISSQDVLEQTQMNIQSAKTIVINLCRNHQNCILLDDVLRKLKEDLQIISDKYNK